MSKFFKLLSFYLCLNFCQAQSQVLDYNLSSDPNDIKFYFFPLNGTFDNPKEIVFNDTASLQNSGFDQNAVKTVLIIHGFLNNLTIGLDPVLVPAYLNSKRSYNIIAVDWGLLAGSSTFNNGAQMLAIYIQIVYQNIPIVAQRVSDFLVFLGVDPQTVHIVGHSLGAHVSGNAAAKYQTQTNQTISRITGCDPAGPLFYVPFPFPKLNKYDALFVDVIHTNMGGAGDVSLDGDVDFIVNGGTNQPNCTSTNAVDTIGCDHGFSFLLYAASLQNTFIGCPCLNLNAAGGLISYQGPQLQICLASCKVAGVKLGADCFSNTSGVYSVTVTNPPTAT